MKTEKQPQTLPETFPETFPKQLIGCDFPHSSTYNKLVGQLTILNDKEHKSFPEIADWITKNVKFI